MSRVALDSNILLYAQLEPGSAKGVRARDVILRTSRDGVVPVQVLGEFLRVVQRRAPAEFEQAVKEVQLYRAAFTTPPTDADVMERAAKLAALHRLQVWDCVICAVAESAGAAALLSEDLQDGRMLGGLRILNPFTPANDAAIDALIGV